MKLDDLYLSEALRELPIGNAGVDAVVEQIEKNCKEILAVYRESNGKYLYRGMRTHVGSAHRKNSTKNMFATIRKKRAPVDVPTKQHDLLEKLFKEAGLKANRKNSIFCTSDKNIASQWNSDVKIIFLRDGWSGTAFEVMKDDYIYHEIIGVKNLEELKNLKPFEITPNNLGGVLKEEYVDLIFTGKSYFALTDNSRFTEEVFESLKLKQPHKRALRPFY